MKSIVNITLLLIFGVVTGFLSAFGCIAGELPPIEFAEGLTFEVPCGEHVKHVNTITASRIIRLYEVTGDNGETIEVDGEQITRVVESLRILDLTQ